MTMDLSRIHHNRAMGACRQDSVRRPSAPLQGRLGVVRITERHARDDQGPLLKVSQTLPHENLTI